jgi:uncharacterized C2H2 Zn-finger protein
MKPPKMKEAGHRLFQCPACSKTFPYNSYTGMPVERIREIEADYEKHFKATHAHEDASQAAVRVVREATEDK